MITKEQLLAILTPLLSDQDSMTETRKLHRNGMPSFDQPSGEERLRCINAEVDRLRSEYFGPCSISNMQSDVHSTFRLGDLIPIGTGKIRKFVDDVVEIAEEGGKWFVFPLGEYASACPDVVLKMEDEPACISLPPIFPISCKVIERGILQIDFNTSVFSSDRKGIMLRAKVEDHPEDVGSLGISGNTLSICHPAFEPVTEWACAFHVEENDDGTSLLEIRVAERVAMSLLSALLAGAKKRLDECIKSAKGVTVQLAEAWDQQNAFSLVPQPVRSRGRMEGQKVPNYPAELFFITANDRVEDIVLPPGVDPQFLRVEIMGADAKPSEWQKLLVPEGEANRFVLHYVYPVPVPHQPLAITLRENLVIIEPL